MDINKAIEILSNEMGFEIIDTDAEKAVNMAINALGVLQIIKSKIEKLEISGDYGKGVMDCYEIIIKAKEEVENV